MTNDGRLKAGGIVEILQLIETSRVLKTGTNWGHWTGKSFVPSWTSRKVDSAVQALGV